MQLFPAASSQLYVSDVSPLVFNLYNMRRSWVEGTSSRAASSTSANWNTYDGVNSWGTVGAASTTLDRYDTNLWSASTTSFSTTGSKTEALNSSGLSVVQGWVTGSLTNYGLIIQNYSGSTTNAVYVSSSEATTVANRPNLNLTYCVPTTTPTITVTGSLSAFSTTVGAPSAAQTYSVAGTNLTGDILITPPTGFELSTNGTTYSSTLTLPQSSGSVATTTIYVRLTGVSVGSFSGNITHTSSSATTQNLAVSGTVSAVCYVLTLSHTGNGTTPTASPTNSTGCSSGSYVSGELVSLSDATPDSGNQIGSWTGTNNDSSTASTNAWTMTAAAHAVSVNYIASVTCYALTLSHTGNGTTPTASPTNSTGCTAGNYLSGEVISLSGATPDSGNQIGSWTGTNNDSSTASTNVWTMTTAAHAVAVNYIVSPTCYALTLSHTGNGTTPTASPTNSTGCTSGNYVSGQAISLSGAVPDSGYTIASWTGTNNDSSTASTNAWTMTAAAHAAAVNYTMSNVAPNAPVLIQPTDNAIDQSTSPTLQVTASDTNPGGNLTVNFYGRPVGETGEDFTLVLMPDSQNMSQYYPAVLSSATAWIASHKTSNNIVFTTTAGDMVNTSSDTAQYVNADAAIDNLDAGSVWYSVAPGNHDTAYGTTYYSNYFGISRYAPYLYSNGFWFGGSYDDYNTYSLFSASGNDFILINLQYSPSAAVIAWADGLLTTYSSRRAIVEQHDMLNINNTWSNQTSYNTLRSHSNLFMMLCGHNHSSSDGAAYIAGTGTDTHRIHVVMADYQDYPNGGNGYLRFFRFSPANDLIYMTTYSPYLDASITNTTNYDTANLDYDLTNGKASSYTLLGTSTVANGSNASIVWNGLDSSTEYEWYATVSDSALTTTGPTWSFTTGVGNNVPPVITEGTSTTVTMDEDSTPTPFSLTLNATDANPGDTLTWSISTAASHGTASASGTGFSKGIGYTPVANWNGTDSFIVMVSDGFGGTDTITVNVNITAANDAPVCSNVTLTVNEDTAGDVAPSCTDVDGNPLTYSIVAQGASGTASVVSNLLHFVPTANINGSVTFTYNANDGTTNSNTANAVVTINPVNDAPVCSAVALTINEDTAGDVAPSCTDVEGNTLTYSIVAQGASGAASVVAGQLHFVPAANINGSVTFTYNANDGTTNSNTANAVVTITPVNDAPVAVDDTYSTPTDTALVVTSAQLVSNDTDVEGSALSVTAVSNPINGSVNLVSGTITFTPTTSFTGSAGFDYTVSDGDLTDTGHVTVSVGSVLTHSIPLIVGWNLVSFNLHPANTATGTVLADIAGHYDLVYAWDASGAHSSAGNWLRYDPVLPS